MPIGLWGDQCPQITVVIPLHLFHFLFLFLFISIVLFLVIFLVVY